MTTFSNTILIVAACALSISCKTSSLMVWEEADLRINRIEYAMGEPDTLKIEKGTLYYTITNQKGARSFTFIMPERTIKGSYAKSFKKLRYRVSVENWDTGVVHVEDYEYYQGVLDGLWEYYTNGKLEYTTLWDNGVEIEYNGKKFEGYN